MIKFFKILTSKILMGVLLIVFAVACAWATFIENDFGTASAKILVYDSLWFKIMLTLLSANILAVIFKDKLLRRGKLTVLIFHVSFIVILIGGAITDIFGMEGMMSIREGEKTNQFLSNQAYIKVWPKGSPQSAHSFKVHFAKRGKNKFDKKVELGGSLIAIELTGFDIHRQAETEFQILELSFTSDGKTQKVDVPGAPGMKTMDRSVTLNGNEYGVSYGSIYKTVPFEIYLSDFIMERYPGSNSPASYESKVKVIDNERQEEYAYEIYMNHILTHRGYRFFQSSYDTDEKGTILSVNKDPWGTRVTYFGYILLTLGMLLSLVSKKTRFMAIATVKSKTAITIIGLLCTPIFIKANSGSSIPQSHVDLYSKLLIQDTKGRIKPMYTHASEVLRKVSRKNDINGMGPAEWMLDVYADPVKWYAEPFIKTKHGGIQDLLGTKSKYVSLKDLFVDNDFSKYRLSSAVSEAYHKKPAYRTKFDTEVIRADERVNVLLMTMNFANMSVFPSTIDSLGRWYNPYNYAGHFAGRDSVFVANILALYQRELQQAKTTGNWDKPQEIMESLQIFQQNNANYDLPKAKRVNLEILYYKTDIFNRIAFYYFFIGFILLILQFINVFKANFKLKVPQVMATVFIAVLFLLHGSGLTIRWIVSGHAPWSNGYEALVFISWVSAFAGLLFSRKSGIVLSVSAILAFLLLNTAHLSFMDPQITNLVPVLNSYWLILHVAIITASYAFLGIGALLAAFNLLLMFFENAKNKVRVSGFIGNLTLINEINLIVGLYLLTISTFLGGVWANESWGRYWGWDPKETWALITIIIYAFVLHMRMIPGLKGRYAFNLMALLSFGSVLMTYFGVNYYLSGLHSYATGDPVPVPMFVYYTIGTIFVVALLAYINQRNLKKEEDGNGR